MGLGDAQRRGWNAAGTLAYDVRENRLLYEEAQVTYNTDCCGFSAQYRRINVGLRDETQLFISFQFIQLFVYLEVVIIWYWMQRRSPLYERRAELAPGPSRSDSSCVDNLELFC